MNKLAYIAMACGATLLALASSARAQSMSAPAQPSAPVPAQLLAAKSVFIANGGYDAESLDQLQTKGDGRDAPYDQIYAAMKTWGRYTLASAPADADLIFTIRLTSPLDGCGGNIPRSYYAPQLTLTIVDVKTHFTLWSITEPVQSALLASNWKKNFGSAITALVNDVKNIVSVPGSAA